MAARFGMAGATTGSVAAGSMAGAYAPVPNAGYPGAIEVAASPQVGDLGVCSAGTCGAEFGGTEPFVLVEYDPLAAGAITAGTTALDFHDADQSDQVTTDGLIPDGVETFEARLFIG